MSKETLAIISLLSEMKQDKNLTIDFFNLKTEIIALFTNLSAGVIEKRGVTHFKIAKLLNARHHFDNCISILKNHLEFESNSYIIKTQKEFNSYQGFVHYLGISLARLDLLQGKDMYSTNAETALQHAVFKHTLHHLATTYIVMSLKNAYVKFKNVKEGTVKDNDLFFYKLFTEMYHVSEIEGGIARQVLISQKVSALKTLETEIPNLKAPPNDPVNLRKQENAENAEIDINSIPEEQLYA